MEPKLITSMSSRAVGAPVLIFLVALALASSMPSAMADGPVTAKSLTYTAQALNWVRTGRICANLTDDGSQPLVWRSRYPWALYFAEESAPLGEDACFLCLQVTNAAPDTDNTVTVRIVDISDTQAGEQPIMLDETAFNQIDGGNAVDGQLQVNYAVLNCPDDN